MYDYIKRREEDERPRRRAETPSPEVILGVRPRRVLDWLSRGAGDVVACRGRSLVFGLCYVSMGHAIARAHARDAVWLEGFVTGFLLLGPLLAVGTYELSRQRELGERADLLVALFAWCRNPRGIGLHALLLCVVLTLWLQLSWALLGRADPVLDTGAAPALASVLRWAAWIAFAALAFVCSVVAVPMLLDRAVSAGTAVRTSLACCLLNPATMGVWAVATASLIGVSLWLNLWPLLLSGPWIGHATWHVYRDCVTAASSPPSSPAVP